MEKIETKAGEIKKEAEIRDAEIKDETAAEILPKKVSPKKEKIKKNKIYKKMEKSEEPKSVPKKGLNWLKIVVVAFILGCILGLSGAAFYFYRQYKKSVSTQAALGGEEQAAKEAQAIKETIGQFMELPADEEPVMATVTDVEKIKTQSFFINAQNGDKVLIYTKNKKAILYRPSTKKIIEVSILSGTDSATAVNPAAEPVAQSNEAPADNSANAENTAKVAVYNGGDIKGLAQKIGDRVALISGVTVSEKTNASSNYEKNLVIDLSGSRGELAQKIAETIGGEIGTLPEGETKPEADILIIAAKE